LVLTQVTRALSVWEWYSRSTYGSSLLATQHGYSDSMVMSQRHLSGRSNNVMKTFWHQADKLWVQRHACNAIIKFILCSSLTAAATPHLLYALNMPALHCLQGHSHHNFWTCSKFGS